MKKIKFKNIFFFNISCFLRVSCYFQHKKKKLVKKKSPGVLFFVRKTILSYFTFYAIFNFKKIETPVCPSASNTFSLLVKWEVVSPVVDRDSWNLYPLYPLFPCSDIVSQMWEWFGGGGGCNVFLTFYAISNISRNKIWEYKTIISHLMFSSCFFFVCWKYWKVHRHLQLLVKWEVVSPNSRYREFYHEIGNIEKCLFTYWLNVGDDFSKS